LLTGQPVTGAINGINLVYTTASPFIHTLPKKEIFYVNGVRQTVGVGNDYTVSESIPLGGFDTLTMVYYAPRAGDVLTIDYYPDI
jgi:ribose/xylose/arabinose/galactoside ABC-type transport system permease subunit